MYEEVFTGHEGDMAVEEQDCTPEVLVDEELAGEQALYHGHGQVQILGVVDMLRAGVKYDDCFASAEMLSRQLLLATVARMRKHSGVLGSLRY